MTGKYVKSIVAHRLQAASNELPDTQSKQPLQTSPSSYEVGQLVVIHCEDGMAGQRCRRYSGCWAIIEHVYESAVVVAVGGEVVRYLPSDLQLVENASLVLRQVCDLVVNLWRVPNLPSSVRYLLEFYQRRLDFDPGDLVVLETLGVVLGKSRCS